MKFHHQNSKTAERQHCKSTCKPAPGEQESFGLFNVIPNYHNLQDKPETESPDFHGKLSNPCGFAPPRCQINCPCACLPLLTIVKLFRPFSYKLRREVAQQMCQICYIALSRPSSHVIKEHYKRVVARSRKLLNLYYSN